MERKYNKKLIPTAKTLRKTMTKEERHLWYDFLKDYPLKFVRQKVLGRYIADFYCAKVKLVIELDGSHHYTDDGVEYDMDSIQVRVQYNVVDMTDDTNKPIVEQVAGAPEGYNGTTSLGDAFVDKDTSADNISAFSRRRVIARVSTRVKVYIPYKSPILQWLVQDSTEDNHFSIAEVEEDAAGNETFSSDGVWYEHIQYVGILR